jgi:transcriptional regulator with XRE-family HTH domain
MTGCYRGKLGVATSTNVGHRIKQRRQALGLSLREVARKAGVSAAFVSQVERGQSNTSIDTLRRIAEALDVPILYFLSDDTSAKTSTCTVHVVRSSHRPQLQFQDDRVSYQLLTPDLQRTMEVIVGQLSPGSGNIARPLKVPTEECIYVISGALVVGVNNEQYILHAGDSIYFEGTALNKLACASESEDAVWISMITPPVF